MDRREFESILWEKNENIVLLTVNNEKKLNALSSHVCKGLAAALRAAEEDPEVRVIVLRGAGEKAFIAGADISEIPVGSVRGARSFYAQALECFEMLERVSKPVIAAVNGLALGGGSEIVIYCDMAIASERARFGFPEAGLGLVPGFGIIRLHQLVGRNKAKELMMVGDQLTAQEACDLGIVNRVVPHEQLMDTVFEVAGKIAAKAPYAIEVIKSAVNRDLGGGDFTYANDALTAFFFTKDLQEGVDAFLNKRRPVFKGE